MRDVSDGRERIRPCFRSVSPWRCCLPPVSLPAPRPPRKQNRPRAKGPAQAEATYDDPLGRSTPQGTVVGFLKAMQRQDYERTVDYLDTRQTGKRAEQLAFELNYILNEGMSTVTTTLSIKPEGNLQDNLPDNRELVGTVRTKRGEYRILLERVQKENNPPVWLFSSETLKLVPQIYEEIDIPWLERHLPAAMTETRLAGQPLYRWIVPLVVLPLVLFLGWLFTRAIFALVREPMRNRFGEAVMSKLRGIGKPLMLLFASVAVYVISLGSASLLTRLFWTFMASTMAVVGLTWLILYLIDAGAEIIEGRRPEAANAVIRLSATLMKALAVVVGLVVIFYYFAGINLTAVVAGLGIGGIAVAFAAQKTIENFFGGLFLVWDKPIRLGDYCKAGEHAGTVEHIGLRSTLIRTLESHRRLHPQRAALVDQRRELRHARPVPLQAHPEPALRDDGGPAPLRPGSDPRASLPAPPGGLRDGTHPLRRLRAIVD